MKHGVLVLAVTLMIAIGPRQSQSPNATVLVANMDDDSVWLVDRPSGTYAPRYPRESLLTKSRPRTTGRWPPSRTTATKRKVTAAKKADAGRKTRIFRRLWAR